MGGWGRCGEDRSSSDYVGESLRWSRLSRMVVCRCQWDNQGAEGFRCNGSLPPPHLCVPRFPNFPLDGGLVLGDRLLFPSSAPAGMGLRLGLLKPRVPEFARQAHVLGAISCPHTPGRLPQPMGVQ